MNALAAVLFAAVLGLQQPGVSLAVDDLTRVRELYALASYEEALARIDAAGPRLHPERAAEYRALCLLGLNRTDDATRTINRLVVERPSYEMKEADVPPRLYALYRDARQRAVPAVARERYVVAKTAFDAGGFVAAADDFRVVLTMLADDAVASAEGLRDLRTLSEGFLALAEAEVRRREHAPAESVTPESVGTPSPSSAAAPMALAATPAPALPDRVTLPPGDATSGTTTARVYSSADADVTPPEEVSRRMPGWNPPAALARLEFRGVLEVVIDEEGRVSSAALTQPVHPAYDESLVQAAARWRFEPATHQGAPVRYRKTFEIVLNRR